MEPTLIFGIDHTPRQAEAYATIEAKLAQAIEADNEWLIERCKMWLEELDLPERDPYHPPPPGPLLRKSRVF